MPKIFYIEKTFHLFSTHPNFLAHIAAASTILGVWNLKHTFGKDLALTSHDYKCTKMFAKEFTYFKTITISSKRLFFVSYRTDFRNYCRNRILSYIFVKKKRVKSSTFNKRFLFISKKSFSFIRYDPFLPTFLRFTQRPLECSVCEIWSTLRYFQSVWRLC